jgi:glycyl-tRNA synthetase
VTAVADELTALGEPDLVQFTAVAKRLAVPLADFFVDVFVMDENPVLRAARLGLLATVRDLGAGLLDWSELRF